MIISGGVNIYPAEIEAVLYEHPQVLDVAVFGIPDDEWGESVYAIVQAKAGRDDRPRRARRPSSTRAWRGLQAAPRLRAARRAAAHRLRQAPQAGAARRVLAGPRRPSCQERRRQPSTLSEHESKRIASRRLRRPGAARAHRRRPPTRRSAAADDARLPGRRQAVRRRDRAQDRARPRAPRPRATPDAVREAADATAAPPPTPTTARSSSWSRRWCRGTRELIAGLHRDPQFGPCVMVGIGGVLAEAIGDVAFRLVPLERVDAEEHDRRARARQALLGPFRGEPAVDRDRARRRCSSACRARRGATRRRGGRRQPADRRRRAADRGRRARGDRGVNVDRGAAGHALFDAARRDRRRRVEPPGQVRVRRAAQHPQPAATRARSTRPTARAATILGHRPRPPPIDDLPDGARRPRVRVHAGRREPRAPRRRARAQGCARRVPHLRRLRRGRGRGPGRRARAGRARGRGARRAARRARTGRASISTPAQLCAQIVAPYPPAGRIGDREPVGQLRLVVRELRGADRRRRQPGRVAPATRPRSASPTTSSTTPTTPRPRSALAYVEGVTDGRALFDRVRAVTRAQAARRR